MTRRDNAHGKFTGKDMKRLIALGPAGVGVALVAAYFAGSPWTKEGCLLGAAKMPSTEGVRVAVDACEIKFDEPVTARSKDEVEAAFTRAAAWEGLVRSGRARTVPQFEAVMGRATSVDGPHACGSVDDKPEYMAMPPAGATSPRSMDSCYVYKWDDVRPNRSATFRLQAFNDQDKTVLMAAPDSIERTGLMR
jgi:hypothetical protein